MCVQSWLTRTGIGQKKFLLCHHGEEIIEWNYIVFKCAVAPFLVLLLPS